MFQNEAVTSLIKFDETEKVTDMLLLTYSMNLRLLNEVILQSGIVNQYANDQAGVEELLTHITCCMQANRAVQQATLAQEKNFRYAYLALAKGRVAMVPYHNKSFHPKVWAFLYKKTVNGQGEQWLRLVVGSRNITGQNMLEGFLCIEGKVGSFPPQGNAQAPNPNPNQALLDLLDAAADATNKTAFSPKFSDSNTSEGLIYNAIKTTDFLPCIQKMLGTAATGTAPAQDDTTASYQFLIPQGAYLQGTQQGTQQPQFNLNDAIVASAPNATKFLAVSPFLGGDKVAEVLGALGKNSNPPQTTEYKIITRSKEYTQTFADAAPKITVHYLKTTTTNPKEDKEPSENDTYTFEANEQPLHAKIYAFDGIVPPDAQQQGGASTEPAQPAKPESHLYIGSANFSANGFKNNYEFMVKLVSQQTAFAQTLETCFTSQCEKCENIYTPTDDDALREDRTFEDIAAAEKDVEAVTAKLIEEHEENQLFMALHEIFTIKNKAGEKPFAYGRRCLVEAKKALDSGENVDEILQAGVNDAWRKTLKSEDVQEILKALGLCEEKTQHANEC